MKYIIWDYNESVYINYKGSSIIFDEEQSAKDLIQDLVNTEIRKSENKNKERFEYEDQYMIEEIK